MRIRNDPLVVEAAAVAAVAAAEVAVASGEVAPEEPGDALAVVYGIGSVEVGQ